MFRAPKLMLKIHCSLYGLLCAVCSILTCFHFCRQMSLRVLHDARAPNSERWNYFVGEKLSREFSLDLPTSTYSLGFFYMS